VLAEPAPLFLWHHDVFTAPSGAIPVLTADRHPNQGFRVGSVWGIQAHPEVDVPLLREWCEAPEGAAGLEAAGVRKDDLLEGAAGLAAGARRILDAWCGVVADRAHR
jgi:GMP synthase (glutamine-hydrolysing)